MMRIFLKTIACSVVAAALTGCGGDEEVNKRTSGFDDFVPRYNAYITSWVEEQQEATKKAILETEEKIQNAEGPELEALERTLANHKREDAKWDFRLGLGDYFRFGTPEEVPDDLIWVDGLEHEEIGDPRAKKGGTFNMYIPTFPPTIRGFGDNSNNSFRGTLHDDIEMPLVGLHPKSMEMIPGLASEWAVSTDGRTVYFRINEKATYSDGTPVSARDFLFGAYLRISDDIVSPYYKQFYRENLAAIVAYDDRLLSISMPEAQPYAPAMVGSLRCSVPHFYEEYGPDFTERYQWKFPPTTGAYEVLEEDIVKGVSITQTRVKDWWAKDNKYYKYRFNPDRIRHVVVRDESKAFELFRAGELDFFYLTRPEYWYEKSEMDPVFDGYIERYTFYTQYPDLPRGIYMNVAMPLLDEKPIRIGIQHSMNWQKVIDVIYRGDYKRLDSFNQGYKLFSDPTIKARKFSITKARQAFAEAGFTEVGRDGILKRPDGTKLSISVSYRAHPANDRMLAILREEAKSCGFDLRLDSNDATVDYKKTMQKQHEMTFTGWVITPPTPDYYQYLHSSNARDERGNLKPQTNNVFSWGRDDTDALCEKARNARSEDELSKYTVQLQQIMHDEAIFVPGYTLDFMRLGSWRWLRWPDSEETRFCAPIIYEPTEVHVHWIDQEMKKETMAAKRVGKTFDEVNRIFDDYRYPTTDQAPEPEPRPAPDPEEEAIPEDTEGTEVEQ